MLSLIKQQFPAHDFTILAVILLLPAFGAVLNGLFGKRMGKDAVRLTALAAIGGSFVLSLVTFIVVASEEHGRVAWTAWRWFSVTGRMRNDIGIDVAFSVDGLSAMMLLVVTGVGFLIHLYSTGYMAKDQGFHRFFAYLNLFIFAMLTLVLGDNLAILFIGWEGVGLASYLLIGFWYDDEKKAAAGKKAFIVNRIGDFGLIIAMVMLVWYSGTLRFSELEARSGALLTQVRLWPISSQISPTLLTVAAWVVAGLFGLMGVLTAVNWKRPWQAVGVVVSLGIGVGMGLLLMWAIKQEWKAAAATLVALSLFLGCAGKSAQIPLYVWLPDAMAGPTPVSALIHAATMVTAGVYLVARTWFIFASSPAAMTVVITVGAVTALFAATIAFAQTDLKKVLAYSTVSQLGFMFIGVGSGAFGAGMFHVVTHAFFKGCLFLCAGSVIHAMHHRIHDDDASQDMRNMGGLRRHMPLTHITFLVSCLAIAGIPPLAGFWSKDEILFRAFTTHIEPAVSGMWVPPLWWGKMIFAIGIVAALGTSFYMFRAYFLTFWGEFRGWRIVRNWKPRAHGAHHDHEAGPLKGPAPHESPAVMTVPLVILATFALLGGFLYAEPIHVAPLEGILKHVFENPVSARVAEHIQSAEGAHSLVWPLMGIGVAVGLLGAAGAYFVYVMRGGEPARRFASSAGGLYRLVRDKWRIDELYAQTIVAMTDALADTAALFDKWVIDGLVARLTAAVTALAGTVLRLFHTGRVQVYAASMVLGVAGVGWFLLRPHAAAEVDTTSLRVDGTATITAEPGHGYTYRWQLGRDGEPGEFGSERTHEVSLDWCDKQVVVLGVRNGFGSVRDEPIEICRDADGCCDLSDAGREVQRDKIRDALGKAASASQRLEGLKGADQRLKDALQKAGIKVDELPAKGGAR